jgi:hypothetical protein
VNSTKKDYVILVAAGGQTRYLTQEADEHDGNVPTVPPTVSDAAEALRFGDFVEARATLRATVKRYPKNEFRLDVKEPLQ